MRREKSLRIGVHLADAVVRGPVYRARLSSAPPTTAMDVARRCPTVAPVATPSGFCAAPSAIVASMLRSPHSAMNTSVNVSQ